MIEKEMTKQKEKTRGKLKIKEIKKEENRKYKK